MNTVRTHGGAALLRAGRLPALVAALASGAVALWLLAVPAPAAPDGVALAGALALLVAFVVAETAQIHIEARRQTYSVSLSEFPLVVGLFYVDPLLILACRLLAYGLVAAVRKVALQRAAFNVASFAMEVAVAAAVFSAFEVSVNDADETRAWGAAFMAVLLAAVVGSLSVALVISVVQPPLTVEQFSGMAVPTLLSAAFTITLGLITVTVLHANSWAVIALALVGGVVVLSYRRFGALVGEHRSLGELYELTRDVSRSTRGSELDEVLLARVRRLLRAEVAQLWLDSDRAVLRSVEDATSHVQDPPDVIRRRVMGGDSVLAGARTRDPELRDAVAARGISDLLAVPLRLGGEVVGSLEVLDRQGERSTFVPSDRALLETLAVHIGVALENARLVRQLRHDADHDPLTGLPNRRAFVERLDRVLHAAAADGEPVAVLVLDLQSFKDVNDTFGRAAGDRLLTEICGRARAAAPEPDAVARLSSDELGVYLPVTDLVAARATASALQTALAGPIVVGGVEIEVGAVVGLALYPDHGTDAVTLVQRADVAMYAAKQGSRGVLAYSPAMDAPSVRRLGLVAELRRAVDAGDLDVWYQPQVSLDQSELVGMEALVRWEHPEHGYIPPDEFVPLAEHTGLIWPLTSFVLQRALEDLGRWQHEGHHFGMSVNISVRSLLDPGFVDEVFAALAAARIEPALLTLEITESSVMADPERAVPVLEALQAGGVRLSVDDFGIGQSSLTYLRRLPVSEVKIDRSFVIGMVHDAGDMAIVRAVIDLSVPLGLTVVAEGVESEETRRELHRLGCGVIQGYLLSRPLPRDGMAAWLARRTVPEPGLAGGPERWLRVVSR